jgi:putative lipoic acid-binding regulatory protein
MANIETPSTEEKPLIDFPCFFLIKVMGLAEKQFTIKIVELIQKRVPSFSAENVEMRDSSSGKYTSLSCNVWVTSQDELDDVYRDITAHPLVKYTL